MDKIDIRSYWEHKYQKAIKISKEAEKLYKKILIEVASQHPLVNGTIPNDEFKARLDFTVDLFNKLNLNDNVYIFVPGSIHMTDEVVDKISLSKAGKNYLIEKGIPANKIFSEEEIDKYKGNDGIYNSADECYVASKIFFDGKFAKMISVCSPYQLMRKALFYVEFGLIANCYSVPTNEMFHSLTGEIFDCLPNVIYEDHNWQDKNKETFQISRKFRKPK